MLEPEDLYEIVDEPRAVPSGAAGPVMLHAIDGFLDAGSAAKLAADHLAETLTSRVLARFDLDLLLDYRARRPRLVFAEDHYEDYDTPELTITEVTDSTGIPFLLLAGPEPDVMWERFAAAVVSLYKRFGVSLVVGLGGVPMTVPHTRPTMITTHGNKPELISRPNVWRGRITVPASAAALLELRMGEAKQGAMGFVAHIPHYLAGIDYPEAAAALLEAVTATTGLALPSGALRDAAVSTKTAVDTQIAEDTQAQQVVSALETQYDAMVEAGRDANGEPSLPDEAELGAELEKFLAQLERREDPGGPQ